MIVTEADVNSAKIDVFRSVVESLKANDIYAYIDESYSGRFMFGQTTVAIIAGKVVSGVELGGYIAEAFEAWRDANEGTIVKLDSVMPRRIDDMGKDARVYY